jgi:hypothetical protein
MIWERLKKGFVRYEMERLPKEKTIDVRAVEYLSSRHDDI